jgi:hypothetical protein
VLFVQRRLKFVRGVGSKLKCPVFVAYEMSGFKVLPSPIGSDGKTRTVTVSATDASGKKLTYTEVYDKQ